jgi:hypothetical protein
MTLSEFNKLDLEKQTEIVWDKGILEHHTSDGENHFILYRVYDFFVEIKFYSPTNDIIQLICFR